MIEITTIETAILAALAASDLSDTVKTIAPYHGEIEDLVAQARQLLIPLPAVYVLYTGSGFTETANRSFDEEPTFTIIVAAKDLRGNASLRAAIYPLIEIIKSALIDSDLSLDIEPLHPGRIDPIAITKAFSIYGFDVKTSFSI